MSNNHFTANLLLTLPVKEFRKSVKIIRIVTAVSLASSFLKHVQLEVTQSAG